MSRRVHSLLRFLLPSGLRRRHGDAMAEAFATALREARAAGRIAVVRVWLRETVDLVSTAVRLRLGRRRRSGLSAPVPRRRRGRLLTVVSGDVRSAVKTLSRRPTFTLFAAATMALGIAAATTVFSALEAVVINPLPYDASDRIVALFESSGTETLLLSPAAESVQRWRAQRDVFDAVEPVASTIKRLTGQGPATTVEVALIRPQFHSMLDRQPLLGRPFTDGELKGEGARVVLLSHAFWNARFDASPAVLGENLELDGEPWTVIGVMPPRTVLPTFDTSPHQLWLPLSEQRQSRTTGVVALMRPSVTLDDVNGRFEALHRQAAQELGERAGPRGLALLLARTRGGELHQPLRLLSLAVGLLVLIACINVANLLLGAATEQRRELAVRIALGASRGNIFRQLLAQSLLLACVGAAVAALLVRAAMAAIALLRPDRLELLDGAAINANTLLFAVVVTFVSGTAAGILPAVSVTRRHAGRSLRRRASSDGVTGQRTRWCLIAAEVAVSFVLLVSSLVVAANLFRLNRVDVGFDADRLAVIGVSLPPWKYQEGSRQEAFSSIEARLAGHPGVERMAVASGVPPSTGINWGQIGVDDGPLTEEPQVLYGPAVGPGYFAALGQRIVAGRPFTEAEIRDKANVVVVGEELVRRFIADRDPIGARLRLGDDDWEGTPEEADSSLTIVGVARDVAMRGPAGGPLLQMYRTISWGDETGAHRTFILCAVADRAPRELLPAAREIVLSEDDDILVTTLDTGEGLMRSTLGRQRFMTSLLSAFATLALLLAAVGLYGVIAELVGQRTHELGIRMALGADGRAIRRAVLSGGAGATALGLVSGLPLLWLAARLTTIGTIEDVTGDPLVLIGAAGAIAAAALLAAYVPARRATRIDPMTAMRTDR